jgi:hypothetical protein
MLRTAEGIATPYGPLSRELAEFIRETRPLLLLLCPPCRPRHRRRRIATATAALIGTATISLLASAHAFAELANQAKYLAQERHACAIVLGLDPSEAPYQDCVAVLERNLPPRDPPLAIASAGSADLTMRHKANAACTDIGLDQGSLSYGRCVLDSIRRSRTNSRSIADARPPVVQL